jgi:hypothetical protein
VPGRHPLNLLLLVLPLLVAAVGWRNPVDALARGKWVRHFDTVIGQETGTVCIPAETWDEVPQYAAELPEVVARLRGVGASVVGIDLPDEHLDEPALRAAAGDMPLVLPGDAHTQMRRSWAPELALGPMRKDVLPMSFVVWEAHTGTEHEWVGHDDHALFMPVLIPFHHWDRRDEWTAAEGDMVFIGACRADRELTRYGRQPAVVAHGEMVETLIEGRFPRYTPLSVDLLLALLTTLGVALARRRHIAAAIGVGAGMLAMVMLLSLTLTWFGWSGIVVGAICGAVMKR